MRIRTGITIITLLSALILLILPAKDNKLIASSQDMGEQITELFSNRCLQCHGPDAFDGRGAGGINYILDFAKLIENEIVIPGDPDESILFELVDIAEMPADGTAPLEDSEIELIRNWILSLGDTTATTDAAAGSEEPAGEAQEPSGDTGRSDLDRFIRYLGKFHPLVVHFPIALILFAGLFELMAFPRWVYRILKLHEDTLRQAARLFLIFAALTSIVATVLGWFNAAFSSYPEVLNDTLEQHRWSGTILTVLTLITVFLNRMRFRRFSSSNKKSGVTGLIYGLSLLVLCVLITIAGHLGGTLVFGIGYLNW